jgi:hypothetical protein
MADNARQLLEQVLDLIAETLITNGVVNSTTILSNQKTIRNGIVTIGLESANDPIVLFDSDIKANEEDMFAMDLDGDDTNVETLAGIVKNIHDAGYGIDSIDLHTPDSDFGTLMYLRCADTGLDINITPVIQGNGNPYNVSQFISVINETANIDRDKANEFLDTRIFELLPGRRTRQQQIDDFFTAYNQLKGHLPDGGTFPSDDYGNFYTPEGYNAGHDISFTQNNPDDATISETDSFITRLNADANASNNTKTLQYLRDDLNIFLQDIDQELEAGVEDERPLYVNKSDGYVKIRNLNQGIVIRKQEGTDIGIEKLVAIGEDSRHPHQSGEGPSYLMDGFTITMWVKFLDKTSKGTLFNYGNPTRALDPKGFKLETYVLNKDDEIPSGDITWGELDIDEITGEHQSDLFKDNETERFIRLVVYDHLPRWDQDVDGESLYDSRMGIPGIPKTNNVVGEFGYNDTYDGEDGYDHKEGYEKYLLTHTRVPIDFGEWYFIVANYNPLINDNTSISATLQEDPDYWRGNKETDGTSTYYSGYGSKCKVEIISRSDLIRARGYRE